jgi:hypothetical protein
MATRSRSSSPSDHGRQRVWAEPEESQSNCRSRFVSDAAAWCQSANACDTTPPSDPDVPHGRRRDASFRPDASASTDAAHAPAQDDQQQPEPSDEPLPHSLAKATGGAHQRRALEARPEQASADTTLTALLRMARETARQGWSGLPLETPLAGACRVPDERGPAVGPRIGLFELCGDADQLIPERHSSALLHARRSLCCGEGGVSSAPGETLAARPIRA